MGKAIAPTEGKAVSRYCEARTRRGTSCRRPAGWGTGHPGRGRCVKHGGKTPNQEKHEARALAIDLISGQYGAQVPIDPLDAAVKVVELAHGQVEACREQLAKTAHEGKTPSVGEVEAYRVAMTDLGRMTDLANKAGVADRLLAIGERLEERIALAAEEALAQVVLSDDDRLLFAQTFATALARMESGGPLQLPRGDADG